MLNVNRLAFLCLAASVPAFCAGPDTGTLLKTVEARYNKAQSLRLEFSESYAGPQRPVQRESGTLWLKKPGRMRWDYRDPAGKIFLSDGKDVYLYLPEEHRAEKSRLKESEDMRAPLAFLLGRLDFAKEFRSFETRADQTTGNTWVVALPKSENLAYTEVQFLASADGAIHRVVVTGQDRSRLEFVFSGEQMNAPVSADQFVFRVPPGVQIVQAEQ